MSFEPVDQTLKSFTHVGVVRFAIASTPTTKTGRLTIPPSIISELGWTPNIQLEVLAGEGEDKGWFGLKPAGEGVKYRAKLKIARNGVARFSSKALVPEEIVGSVNTMEPETRIDDGMLFIKVL
jgi:bifunctional DNA-binding transcriptional regulator/antitoxin component of YhaV-PrlF toxin-antitoxin module